MQNEGYINIQGWMINELKLNGNELLLYALIFGFSQDDKSEFYGSLSYIQKALKISKPTVILLIKKLVEKKLIKRVSQSHFIYSKETLPLVKKLYPPSKETLPLGSKETLHNIYNTNNKSNNSISSKEENADDIKINKNLEINTIYDLYKSKGIDLPLFFGNPTEKKSAKELYKSKGIEKISNMLDYCLELVGNTKKEDKRFLLRFDTPYHLLKNYEAIKMKM